MCTRCGALLLQHACGVWFCGLQCGAGSDEVRSMVPQHRSGNHTTVETHTSNRCTSSDATHTPPPHMPNWTNDGQTLACLHTDAVHLYAERAECATFTHSLSISYPSMTPQPLIIFSYSFHLSISPLFPSIELPVSCIVGEIMDMLVIVQGKMTTVICWVVDTYGTLSLQ